MLTCHGLDLIPEVRRFRISTANMGQSDTANNGRLRGSRRSRVRAEDARRSAQGEREAQRHHDGRADDFRAAVGALERVAFGHGKRRRYRPARIARLNRVPSVRTKKTVLPASNRPSVTEQNRSSGRNLKDESCPASMCSVKFGRSIPARAARTEHQITRLRDHDWLVCHRYDGEEDVDARVGGCLVEWIGVGLPNS